MVGFTVFGSFFLREEDIVKLNSKWIVVVLMLVGLANCRMSQLQNIENTAVAYSSGEERTLDQIEKAIIKGGAVRGWVMSPAGPGHLIGTLRLRSHVAIVDITFNTKTYSIKYKDSTNLKYRKNSDGIEYIHSNYVSWIRNLRTSIDSELLTM